VAQDGMTIRLHLKGMKVLRVVEDEIDKLVIEVADTRTVVRCPACGHRTTRVHETRRVVVSDLPLGRPTTLIWLQRRFECPDCGERHTEDHPEIEGKVTRRLARQLVGDAKYLTIRELSRRHRVALRHGPGPRVGHPGRHPSPVASVSGAAVRRDVAAKAPPPVVDASGRGSVFDR
jgi:predicted RNA-binding Zn-ribbon protein involved in translation (DUF1610 family)